MPSNIKLQNWPFNLFPRVFVSEVELDILNHCPNFDDGSNKINIPNTVASLEPVLSVKNSTFKHSMRNEVTKLIFRHIYSNLDKYSKDMHVIKTLPMNSSILIIIADTWHMAVILDRSIYSFT